MLERLGRWCARRHWWVIGAWILIAIVMVMTMKAAGGQTHDVFTIPGTDSQAAVDLLNDRFPAANLPSATVVYATESGTLTDPPRQAAIEAAIARMEKAPEVKAVGNPFETGTEGGGARLSTDGTIASIPVTYSVAIGDLTADDFAALQSAAAVPKATGVDVQYGGMVTDVFNQQNTAGISKYSDEIGLLIAVVIILFAFGSVVAMGLPLGTALFGLAVALSTMLLLASVFTIGTVAPVLGTMIGLGVGIDYSLFIVTRYRQQLAQGDDVIPAVGRAIGTAGSAVLFAGMTVCLALVGLSITGIPYVAVLGYASALVVAVMVAAALTLLPALLGLVGRKVDKGHVPLPGSKRRERKELDDGKLHGWAKWADDVAKRPLVFVTVSLVILLLLAAPIFKMDLGFVDDGNQPTSLTQRQAYDLVTRGFGPGANGPLLIAIALPPNVKTNEAADLTAVEKIVTNIEALKPAVSSVVGPIPNADATAAIISVIPSTAPSAPQTQDLVRKLRKTVIPAATQGGPIAATAVHVGGQTAELIDLTDRIQDRLWEFIGIVVFASFFLLLLVFRSILVPLKAAIMNLLSIGASYGVIVAVFQWGWLRDAVGLEATIPIEAFVPLMMFAILFGLSMDYEVFLMSRIRESFLKTGDSRASVGVGITETARVITSAALIMIAVFLSFVTNPNPTVKMLGLGLAVAVFVDATVVRLMLVPATMELLGSANWWFPRWLNWLPKINLEGGDDPGAGTPDDPGTGASPEGSDPAPVPVGASAG